MKLKEGTTRYIFITGGTLSSLGKGIASATIATLLAQHSYRIGIRKFDPYLNSNAGMMGPYEHGEVFVTDDGGEVDLDFGHYERFLNHRASKDDSITSGKVFAEIFRKEKDGDYIGTTIQFVPHATDIIKSFIARDHENYDFIICEIGGVVGDIEGMIYLEAIRQISYDVGRQNVAHVHMGLVPFLETTKEFKTKPLQHSVKELRSYGINADIIMCRSKSALKDDEIRKIEMFSNLPKERIIQATDCSNVYKIPYLYHENGMDRVILEHFLLPYNNNIHDQWRDITYLIAKRDSRESQINLMIVGKYQRLEDSYKSITESIEHASIATGIRVHIQWLDSEALEAENCDVHAYFSNIDAIMVPGGFGARGTLGIMRAIQHAREGQIPFFGICYGMQLAIIEYARNVLNMTNATTSEISQSDDDDCVICTISELNKLERAQGKDGTEIKGEMRLGLSRCLLEEGSKIHKIYQGKYNGEWESGLDIDYNNGNEKEIVKFVDERHRHRFEFNNMYKNRFLPSEMRFSSLSEDGLVEAIELRGDDDQQFFIAVQFHPEFLSRPSNPHPLFVEFLRAGARHAESIKSRRI